MRPITSLEGTFNFRDLGGLPLPGGGETARGVVYRSDALDALTPAGLATLDASNVGTVFDLRTSVEASRAPDLLPASGTVTLLSEPILGGAMDEMARHLLPDNSGPAGGTRPPAEMIEQIQSVLPELGELYTTILDTGAAQFAAFGRAVATPRNPERPAVVVHCTAGKDRTGIAAALALAVAGVRRDVILADYEKTAANLAGPAGDRLLRLVTDFGIPVTPALRTLTTGAPRAAMEHALDWIDEHYVSEHYANEQWGSAAAYLMSGGMTADEITRMRSRLTGS